MIKRIDRRDKRVFGVKLQQIAVSSAAAAQSAATAANTLETLPPKKGKIERTYFDRKTLRELIPWDTDEEMLNCLTGAKSAQFTTDLRAYLGSLGRDENIAQNGLTACFESRYLRNHIWDDFKTK